MGDIQPGGQIWSYSCNESGNFTAPLFADFLLKHVQHVRVQYHIDDVLLLVDEAAPHYGESVLEKLREDDKIHVLLIPACCTWWMQPLDVMSFSLFKRAWRQRVEREYPVTPSQFLLSIRESIGCLDYNVITKSFAMTGLYPFNEELILEKCVCFTVFEILTN